MNCDNQARGCYGYTEFGYVRTSLYEVLFGVLLLIHTWLPIVSNHVLSNPGEIPLSLSIFRPTWNRYLYPGLNSITDDPCDFQTEILTNPNGEFWG